MDSALGGCLSAFEVMWNNFYTLVTTEPATNQPPISHEYPYYVLVEAMGADDARTEAALAENLDEAEIVDPVLPEFRPVPYNGCGNGRSGGRVVPARRAGGV